MMFTQQTEATTCPTIEATSRERFSCTKSLRVNLAEGRRAVTKTPKHTGITRRKIKLEAVSFDDLNFSSSGGEQLPKRFMELLNHCGGEHLVSAVRRRLIERVVFTPIPARLPRFVPCRVGVADRQPTQAHIDPDRPRTQCSREHAEEAVRPNRLDPTKPPIPTLAEYMTKAWSDR